MQAACRAIASRRSHLETRLKSSHCSSVLPPPWKACRRMRSASDSGRQLQLAVRGGRPPICHSRGGGVTVGAATWGKILNVSVRLCAHHACAC